jgi:hypothetical protein
MASCTCDERASKAHSGIEELNRLPVFRSARKVVHEGNILEFRVRGDVPLEKDHGLVAGDPVWPDGGYGVE